MSKSEKTHETDLLLELKAIRKLLTASLLVEGVDAKLIAEFLGYKSSSSITNEFPVRKLQKTSFAPTSSHSSKVESDVEGEPQEHTSAEGPTNE